MFLRYVYSILCGLVAGFISAAIFIPLAEAERGVAGCYGGEWILIIGAALFAVWATMPQGKGGGK